MELQVNIETIDDMCIEAPVTDKELLQIRSDGVLVNGKLHFWENIMWMSITNRGLLRELKEKRTP